MKFKPGDIAVNCSNKEEIKVAGTFMYSGEDCFATTVENAELKIGYYSRYYMVKKPKKKLLVRDLL